ncbi:MULTISPECIES: DEAD/DEAH box helicase family protein [unclassified Ruminococcus]|uniref:DEAD/DEAH box helicase family protein n=1 Tax=unclassified Ruminococcus TaxID=2608920 RepID=UPI00210E2592|nr:MULTISPECIES: DEAD/DEAH box helicase family protein [unclassified Ruminococcus]MCQ4023275.1 hypothetical protein [Ruminococcus sp. zg-924]MCQ4115061.1 hypothetical protein [Ruminococcus sp. zg-921]
MKTFEHTRFNGVFRDYQQKVLNNAQSHINDGKIHIVAAPGSGKTILGLELIRRINRPALILSPSVTIKQQWGERFCSGFLNGQSGDGYISYDLKNPSLLTSVTYQALHSAFTKTSIPNEHSDDDDDCEYDAPEDFKDFDLIAQIKAHGIGTICLDEAHHLRSEWQKSLEGFIEAVSGSVYVISLTATPPYDSTPNEWKRYISLCGEIDEEIFVPQLVAQKTLCPHQDYIYFNYPTDEETAVLRQYNQKAEQTVKEVLSGEIFKQILFSPVLSSYRENEECILDNTQGFIAILCLAKHVGVKIPNDLITLVSPSDRLPEYSITFAQTAFQFVIDSPSIFGEQVSKALLTKLSQSGLIEKKAVALTGNGKINKMMISSLGKLKSIEAIASAELKSLGCNLRMLILTDYIKRDMLGIVGTQSNITSMGTVPIFEALRRTLGSSASIAVLSGGLVILPNNIITAVSQLAAKAGVEFSSKPIADTSHSEAAFSGSNKNKVAVITEAFSQGLINILIGTKSLLGEGWDSPCINSLILASFVGSFMLSNQMRGRAIRMDKTNPGKASNIWHLVTVEPDTQNSGGIAGNDFATMERRFEGFLAPSYNKNTIESGVQRLDIIKPPYTKEGFDRINAQMLELSQNRAAMAARWQNSIGVGKKTEVIDVSEIPAEVQPQGYSFKNRLALVMLIISLVVLVVSVVCALTLNTLSITAGAVLAAAFALAGLIFAFVTLSKTSGFVSPKKTVQTFATALLRSLKSAGEINSQDAYVEVTSDKAGTTVSAALKNASAHEKEVFKKAIKELLSPIENPRYVLVKKKNVRRIYSQSYACPAILGTKKENAQLLAANLRSSMGDSEVIYTRSREGRAELLACRKQSYINKNDIHIRGKKAAVSEWS